MLSVIVQEAGIEVALVVAVGFALLARLLYKPKSQQVIKDNKPNTATQRGSFIPLVIGTRQVGAVVLWVGNRRITIEQEEVGGKGSGSGGTVEKTIYHEKAIHALCVGPASHIRGIFADGVLIPGSTNLNSLLNPSGTSITFPEYGTCRIYWGTLSHPRDDAILDTKLGIDTEGPYVVRVEWDDYRLGGTPRWKIIEYIVEVPPMDCNATPPVPDDDHIVNSSVNYAVAFWQLWTADYPHGGGMPDEWMDFQAVTDMGALSKSENIGCNLLIQDGDTVDRITGELMQDFGFMLPECAGVIAPYPIRKISAGVQSLSNDLLLPPVDEIQRVHLSTLGDALVYEYNDKDQNYRIATIDVDDDSVGAIRNQRKTKKITLDTVTVRSVASKIAKRKQVEDLSDIITIRAKGLRGLRAAQAGQPFELPGVGRVRLISSKLNWNEPTIELELMQDILDQDPIEFDDPGLPGEVVEGDLEPDIRFAAFELPLAANPGGPNAVAVFRHRNNGSIVSANVLVSNDGVSYHNYGTQTVPCAGGVLAADWTPPSWDAVLEEGPLITIDPNGDEDLPVNLSGNVIEWLRGSQIMLIGAGRDAEVFFVREWVEVVADVSYRPTGLVRGRIGAGFKPIHWDRGNYRDSLQGDPCYIIRLGDLTPVTGALIQTGGGTLIKSQPMNAQGILPAAAIFPDDISPTLTPMSIPAPLSWVACGGSYPVPRRDLRWSAPPINPAVSGGSIDEDIVVEVIPSDAAQGAGAQGFGQAVVLTPLIGNLRVEVYMPDISDPLAPQVPFDDLVLANTYEVTFASLTEEGGVYKWIYTDANIRADETTQGWGGAREDWRDDDSDSFHWKFLLYHVIAGVASPPVEIRPASLTVDEFNWIPKTEN